MKFFTLTDKQRENIFNAKYHILTASAIIGAAIGLTASYETIDHESKNAAGKIALISIASEFGGMLLGIGSAFLLGKKPASTNDVEALIEEQEATPINYQSATLGR